MVVALHFSHLSLFVLEEAPVAVHAVILFMELLAELGLVFSILWFFIGNFGVAMSELAFAAIPAVA